MKEEYEKSIYYIASKKPSSIGIALEEVIAVDINNTKSTSTKEDKSTRKNISYKDIMDRFK